MLPTLLVGLQPKVTIIPRCSKNPNVHNQIVARYEGFSPPCRPLVVIHIRAGQEIMYGCGR